MKNIEKLGKEILKEAGSIDEKEIIRIANEYEKLVDKFFNSLEFAYKRDLEQIKKGIFSRKKKAAELFNEMIKEKSTNSIYGVLNGIFGPNEIRSHNWSVTFPIDSQGLKLENLRNQFIEAVKF